MHTHPIAQTGSREQPPAATAIPTPESWIECRICGAAIRSTADAQQSFGQPAGFGFCQRCIVDFGISRR